MITYSIGGVAATLYGCPEQTFDIDILFDDSAGNREKLVAALHKIRAEWDQPITSDLLMRQPLFALNSPLGDLDIFRSIPGVSSFSDARRRALVLKLRNVPIPVLSLSDLIASKEAAGDPNPRKLLAIAYLKALQTQRGENI